MFSFTSFSKEHDLVINIGSGSVHGAIVELKKGGRPAISINRESKFPIKHGVTAEELIASMLGAFHIVLAGLCGEHKKKIRTIHIVFTSPWFSSSSKFLSIKRPEPFVVSEKTVSKIVNEHVETVTKSATTNNSIMIEKAISNMRLNGYDILDPYGKTTKNLDLSIYASMVPRDVTQKIESEIYPVIHPHGIVFHTFPFLAWNVVRSMFSPKDDFLFVDIGGEVSDILIVRRGAINSLVSFPVGRNHLVRKVALHFETAPELADSLINLNTNDVAKPEVNEKVKTLVAAFGEEWNLAFLKAMRETDEDAVTGAGSAAAEQFLPQRAFFTSNANTAKIFTEIIGKQIADVTHLANENFLQFVDLPTGESTSVFMILETIYLNNHFREPENIYKIA